LLSIPLIACEAAKKGSSVQGTITDAGGKPVANVKLVATQQQPLKGYEQSEAKTKSDGSFVLKGLYPSNGYAIKVIEEKHYNKEETQNIQIFSGPQGETKIINNIALKFPPVSPFKMSDKGVIKDSRTGLEWLPSSRKVTSFADAKAYVDTISVDGSGWRLPTLQELKGLCMKEDDYYRTVYRINIDPIFGVTNDTNPNYSDFTAGRTSHVWASDTKTDTFWGSRSEWFLMFITCFEGSTAGSAAKNEAVLLAVRSPK